KGEALEIPHSPEKEPVSCLTDWHYTCGWRYFFARRRVFFFVTSSPFAFPSEPLSISVNACKTLLALTNVQG
ncbi:hypothetical protein, partial [Escherichia coli]|uniref:hypothetical protein n=2 Tax=Escherichia coli TaxID=562 RepID=UPI001B3C5EA2